MYVDWKTTPVTHTDHKRVKLRIKGYEKLIFKEIENTKDREYFNRVFTAYRSQGRSQDLGEERKFSKMVQFGAFLVYIWIKFRL